MGSLFEELPGNRIPLPEVTNTLASLWHRELGDVVGEEEEFHASQMNLILHFGLKTTAEEAKANLETALEFSKRYPCRIIVLCPEEDRHKGEQLLDSKLYSECRMDEAGAQQLCFEVITLAYPRGEASFLENQVSIWLENDLPTYYWLHRVPAEVLQRLFLPFIKKFKRIVYDSTVEGADYRDAQFVKGEERFNDLANARNLTVRQSIGPFLSGVEPGQLVSGLKQVIVRHKAEASGEARNLLEWQRHCIEKCYKTAGREATATFDIGILPDDADHTLGTEWKFDNERFFKWRWSTANKTGHIDAKLDGNESDYPMRIRPLRPSEALAEAIFF